MYLKSPPLISKQLKYVNWLLNLLIFWWFWCIRKFQNLPESTEFCGGNSKVVRANQYFLVVYFQLFDKTMRSVHIRVPYLNLMQNGGKINQSPSFVRLPFRTGLAFTHVSCTIILFYPFIKKPVSQKEVTVNSCYTLLKDQAKTGLVCKIHFLSVIYCVFSMLFKTPASIMM